MICSGTGFGGAFSTHDAQARNSAAVSRFIALKSAAPCEQRQAGCVMSRGAPACTTRRLGADRILGPRMFGVTRAQVFSNVVVGRFPEPGEIAGYLNRS